MVIAAFSRTAIAICPHSSCLNAIHACATLSRMMQTKTIASTTSHPCGHRRVRRNHAPQIHDLDARRDDERPVGAVRHTDDDDIAAPDHGFLPYFSW